MPKWYQIPRQNASAGNSGVYPFLIPLHVQELRWPTKHALLPRRLASHFPAALHSPSSVVFKLGLRPVAAEPARAERSEGIAEGISPSAETLKRGGLEDPSSSRETRPPQVYHSWGIWVMISEEMDSPFLPNHSTGSGASTLPRITASATLLSRMQFFARMFSSSRSKIRRASA